MSVRLNPKGVVRALDARKKGALEPEFVGALSRELSDFPVDLWLDGFSLRGIVPGNAGKEAEEALRRSIENNVRKRGCFWEACGVESRAASKTAAFRVLHIAATDDAAFMFVFLQL